MAPLPDWGKSSDDSSWASSLFAWTRAARTDWQNDEAHQQTDRSSRHPISEKLIAAFRRFQRQAITKPDVIADAKSRAEELQKTVVSDVALAELEPAHAVYVHTQNMVSVLSEQLTRLPEMSPFVDLVGKAEDEYMPSGPPMSPLTTSHFVCWALFDACVSAHQETIGTCILDLGPIMGMNPELLQHINVMQRSRMGLYMHAGVDGGSVMLRELITGAVCRAMVPAGHQGSPGELWLARVLPPPAPGFSDHVVFTTPYVIVHPDQAEWIVFFRRTFAKMQDPDEQRAYKSLMKFGLERRYWNEYIFEAYLNYQKEVIFLTGLPDVAESRPHSRQLF